MAAQAVLKCNSCSWVRGQGTRRAFIRPIDNEIYMIKHLRCPLAMNSRGRTVLMENVEISTSLSGIIRHFEGFEMQPNAATIINAVSFHGTLSSVIQGPQNTPPCAPAP